MTMDKTEMMALADRIEASDGLFTMHGDKPRQLGIRKSAEVIAALRLAAGASAGAVSDSDLRTMWRNAGGEFYGPRVETGSMPEAKLLPFLRSLAAKAALTPEPVKAGDEVMHPNGENHATLHTELDRTDGSSSDTGRTDTRSSDRAHVKPPEYLWWGEVDGKDVVTFGRWPKRGARWRYKLAETQPTEHDHPKKPPASQAVETVSVDARRYHRLRVLGCAPAYSKHLQDGSVLRFTNLDEFVDADIERQPSRGEALSTTAPQPDNGARGDQSDGGFDECSATGQSCIYAGDGPNNEFQCIYCGKPQSSDPAPAEPVSVEELRDFIYVRQPCYSKDLARALLDAFKMENR
jgi:hypothetical protein